MLKRFVTVAVVAALLVPAAYAHFVFVIPDKGGAKASVVFSDALEPDPDVDIAKITAIVRTRKARKGRAVGADPLFDTLRREILSGDRGGAGGVPACDGGAVSRVAAWSRGWPVG